MPDQIRSIEDLEEVRAAAAAQGASVTNYNEWYQIMQQLEELGVESTGSYAGDKAKIEEVQQSVEDYIREAQIEQQLRELTLLPLNIKHMSVKAFLQTGAPRGAALIIAPYTMPLPLFSPPLIYTDLTLTTHQQEQIRKMLESA